MKTSIIILIGALGLAGCTGFHRAENSRNETFPYTYSSKPKSPPDNSTYIKSDPSVRDLPKEAQDILNAAGIKDIVFVAAVDKNGRIRLLKPHNVEYSKPEFPLRNIDILRPPTLMSIIPYEGSPECLLWSKPKGPDKGNGESHSVGGMLMEEGRFCLVPL